MIIPRWHGIVMVILLVTFSGLVPARAKPLQRARPSVTGSSAAAFPGQPPYAGLFQKGEYLARQGNWAAALRLFSRIYGEEVPVDAFYRTLERRTLELLEGLGDEAHFRVGKESYSLGDLRLLFQRVLLPQPEVLYARPLTRRELPLARFVYLCVVAGRPHPRAPGNRLLEYALPRLDLGRALASPDPWLVAAALFMARKGQGRLRAQALIDRWQARPDLWDQVCTDQALLFLAGRPPAELAALKVERSFLRQELSRLQSAPDSGRCWLQALIFWSGSLKMASTDYLQAGGCRGLRVRRRPRSDKGRPGTCQGGILRLEPGSYSLQYISSRAHGRSLPFGCRGGRWCRVVVTVMGNI